MEPEVRRHALKLFGGVLVCGLVVALCIVALVVLLDRFLAPAKG